MHRLRRSAEQVPYIHARRKTALFAILLLFFVLSIATPAASAQSTRSQGQFGVGVQIGNPTGLTTKYYARKQAALVLLGSWNLDKFLLFSSHIVYEHTIPDSPLLFFIGPGFFLGNRDEKSKRDIEVGATSTFGLNFFVEHFEVFLQVTPDLEIWPQRKAFIGGTVGIRYFF